MRHEIICRASNAPHSDPTEFTTLLLTHGEDGWSWGKAPVKGVKLQMHVDALLERMKDVAPEALPAITITTQSVAEIEAAPPLVRQAFGPLSDLSPGTAITILAPIRHAAPRDKFEFWCRVNRDAGGRIWCGDTKYRYSALANELKRFFGDAEDRPDHTFPTFKQWASSTSYPTELWVRPHWVVASLEFLPDAFPLPKERPPIHSPEQMDKAERDADVRHKVALTKRHWASRGYKFDKQGQVWRGPKGQGR